MAVKTTGAEFKRFYNDPEFWPDGAWHEDECVSINGEDWSGSDSYNDVPDDATVRLEDGIVLGLPNDEDPSLETYFKRWRKKRTTVSFVVECDKNQVETVKAVIKSAGGRVK